ncbi:hypothetical protein Fmac_010100 [Flemingia macrophylla]|uniref:Protein kinase domain-containing protein n=1 Tax=Flemingia macrophylla TaxID=520843 RepID=A0ABD1N261_9FABA
METYKEISFLSQFQHKNIVRYLGTDKSSDNKLYIFLELVSKGSLSSLYQRYHLGDSQVSVYTRQILSALKYLHERNVVHRDIKCDNILVHVDGSIKLAGFGLATVTKLNDVKSCKGSVLWMAPEMQEIFRIGRGEPPPIPESFSAHARDFIIKCLQVNPDKRPTAAQLLNRPFSTILKWELVKEKQFSQNVIVESDSMDAIRLVKIDIDKKLEANVGEGETRRQC